ncbi:MAG: exodeoxyribonuclease VII small subunit [Dehalococcoidia bacterium]
MAESKDAKSLPDLESLSFEEAFRQLGEMVESLENGGLPLAQATDLYQQGMELVQRCNQLLNQAQLKITQLMEDQREDSTVAANGADGEEELFEEP